jgi:hypothetical protein
MVVTEFSPVLVTIAIRYSKFSANTNFPQAKHVVQRTCAKQAILNSRWIFGPYFFADGARVH